jgi:hypothetical protein
MTLPPLCVDSSSTSPCPNLEEFVFFSAKSVCDDAQLNSSSIFDTLATMEESQELATSTSTDLILSVNEQSDFMVEKPTYSYATLIGMAILETEEKRARLSTIYSWITNRFPYYRLDSGGWQVCSLVLVFRIPSPDAINICTDCHVRIPFVIT